MDGQCDKLATVVDHQFVMLTVDICVYTVQQGKREALRREHLSMAAETYLNSQL